MTVKELIDKLKSFEENLEVLVSGEGGTFCLDDDALIEIETWKTKDGKDIELLAINF